ncbi:hypothetical protein ACFHWD_03775 [Clostridium sp. MT-14]|uniref:hypothetical protein n=1 Tax=Clostridium sp. MT-14 TaxID=3348360 RepID=UPI0035F3F20C
MDNIIKEVQQLFERNKLDCTEENAKTVLNVILTNSRISRKAILLSVKKFYDLEKD